MINDSFQLQLFLSLFATTIPILIVCIVAGVLITARNRDAAGGPPYALLGFGLLFVLCFVMPLGQMLLQRWVFQDGQQQSRIWAFTAFGFAGSVLHAVIYVLLLMAILARRPSEGQG